VGLTKNSGNHGGPRQASTVSRLLRAANIGIKYQSAAASFYTEVTNGFKGAVDIIRKNIKAFPTDG